MSVLAILLSERIRIGGSGKHGVWPRYMIVASHDHSGLFHFAAKPDRDKYAFIFKVLFRSRIRTLLQEVVTPHCKAAALLGLILSRVFSPLAMAKPYIPPPLMYFESIYPRINAFCTTEYH
jgi:hypothetical protein